MIHRITIWLALCALPATAGAMPIIADISSHQIEIHSSFTGTQLLVFGARNDPGDIVLVIRGPQKNMVVRKKERVAGIWINREQDRFDNIPQFYRVASSRPLNEVRQFLLFDDLAVRDTAITEAMQLIDPFRAALIQLLQQQQLYGTKVSNVEFMGATLFKSAFDFPDHMPRGTYTAEMYLFNEGLLVGMQSIPIEVYKTGSDAAIYDFAQHHGIIYGVLSVLMAIGMGITASWLFKRA